MAMIGAALKKAPVAPTDWSVANKLPAGTFPIPDCTPAATEPAATPDEVNPKLDRIPPAKQGIPPPIADPIPAPFAYSININILNF